MNRNAVIDLLKFLFILVIVLFHGKNFAGSEQYIFKGGSIFVEFFFVVSGFLMVASAEKRLAKLETVSVGDETSSFLWRKIKGLLPDLIIAWFIAFAVLSWLKELSLFEMVRNGAYGIFDFFLLSQSGLMGFRANAVTWYLSAMLIAMTILYPLLIKNKNTFLKVIAPLICIFMYGYMYQSWNVAFGGPSVWLGFATKGMLRGIAGISLGCICYGASKKLQALKPTLFLSTILTLIEYGCYFCVVAICFVKPHSQLDYVLLTLIAVGVTITFSQTGVLTRAFANIKLFNWLGVFSFDLFISHGFWSHAMTKIFPTSSYWEIMPYYLALSFGTAFFVMAISKLLKKSLPLGRKLMPIFLTHDVKTNEQKEIR